MDWYQADGGLFPVEGASLRSTEFLIIQREHKLWGLHLVEGTAHQTDCQLFAEPRPRSLLVNSGRNVCGVPWRLECLVWWQMSSGAADLMVLRSGSSAV